MEILILRYELKEKARTRPKIFRVVLKQVHANMGPCKNGAKHLNVNHSIRLKKTRNLK